MKVTRRNFIQVLVGGVAGLHLTPLPWKLTDDIAIWTQNWPWVPVPPTGAFSHEKSVCTLCPGGCGIDVRKVGARAVKIEGRTDYPVNPGGICPVGMGGLQLLYNKDIRFTGPMKRAGARGAGKFVPIGWDEAIEILGARITGLRDEGRADALVAVDGHPAGSTASALIERLLTAVGSPNYLRVASCDDTCAMALALMQGTDGPMAYDLENSDFVLSFGSGLLEGWGAPGRVLNAWGLWRDRTTPTTKVVQIESRASNTASKADRWVAAKPGTEAALALGIAHVLVKEARYDSKFVARYCHGFDDWRGADGTAHAGFKTLVLDTYTPEHTSAVTGVPADDIVSVARAFGSARAPVAVCGKGKGTLNGSLYEFMAVHALNALTGSINREGGVMVQGPLPLKPLPAVEADETAAASLSKPRLDGAGTAEHPFGVSLLHNLAGVIEQSGESAVDTLLVFSANPAYTLPDGGAFRRALSKVPFIVSFSPFRDETAVMADLILPDHTYLEKMDDVCRPRGLQYPLYGLTRPVVDPVYDTRTTGDVIIQTAQGLGDAVGAAFAWESYEEVLAYRAEGLFEAGGGFVEYDGSIPPWKPRPDAAAGFDSFDDMWDRLRSGGLWYRPVDPAASPDAAFNTPGGKFEFFSSAVARATAGTDPGRLGVHATGDEVCMPHYEELPPAASAAAYPLLLLPYDALNTASGWIPTPPFLNKTLLDTQLRKDDSCVELNPKTAARYHVKEGDLVRIQSPSGSILARATLFEGAMPGVVYMLSGLGHTAYDEFLRGKGGSPRDLMRPGTDPLSGLPVWWNTPVKLVKA